MFVLSLKKERIDFYQNVGLMLFCTDCSIRMHGGQLIFFQFFEEKIRLEREASHKIAELAERAQTEALINLDETTKLVYSENAKLNEDLREHITVNDVNVKTNLIYSMKKS